MSAKQPSPRMAYALLSFASLTWAGNIVLGRAVHATIPPVSLSFWRWVLVLLILAPFTVKTMIRQRAALRREWKFLVALGVAGLAGFHTLQYTALGATTAINVALFNAVCPVVIPFFARILWAERLGPRQAAGIAVSLVGVAVIVLRGDPALVLAQGLARGDVIMLGAVACWSLYVTLLKHRPADLHPNVLLVASIVPAVLALFPIWLWEVTTVRTLPLEPMTFLVIGYMGVFAGCLAYIGYGRAVPAIGPIRAGLFLHLIPLFASLLAIGFLGEHLHLFHMVGAGAIIAGIYLTTRP